jgi:hypothetical protein
VCLSGPRDQLDWCCGARLLEASGSAYELSTNAYTALAAGGYTSCDVPGCCLYPGQPAGVSPQISDITPLTKATV